MNNMEVKEIAKSNIITTNELCEKLNITRQYVSLLVKRGRITPFITSPGKHYYWWVPDIEEIVQTETTLFKQRTDKY